MKIYDVTVAVSENLPTFPGDPQVEFSVPKAIAKGDAANVSQVCCGVHTGTHVDAPVHFIEGARRVHELDFDKLLGDCTVIELGADEMSVEPKHVENVETNARILFKTRNSNFWSEPEKGFRKDFTYISPEAAQALIEKSVKLVGIDYLSVEKYNAGTYDTHVTLLKNEVVIIEGLDLREVPAGDYELICLPLKYIGGAGDGAPARTILRQR